MWLPVGAEGSPCLAAEGELVAERDSAGWPVSCAETGAGSAGMRVGFLLLHDEIHNMTTHYMAINIRDALTWTVVFSINFTIELNFCDIHGAILQKLRCQPSPCNMWLHVSLFGNY